MLPIMMVVIYGMIVTSDAVVLHGRDYSDSSRIVVAYLESHGMVSMLAKGIRKPGSGMSGALSAMQESRVTVYIKPGRELQIVSKAEIVQSRQSLLSSYDHMVAAMTVCDMVMRTQVVGVGNPQIWKVVRGGLDRIDRGQRPWLDSVAVRLALVREMGVGIAPSSIGDAEVALAVRLHDGVVMSERHAASDGMMRISTAAWRWIERALTDALPHDEGGVSAADRREVEAFLRVYVGHHTERSIGLGVRELLR